MSMDLNFWQSYFDVVIDTAYTSQDVALLLDALGSYKEYILIPLNSGKL